MVDQKGNKHLFCTDCIDSFVAEGMIDAAEKIGVYVAPDINEAFGSTEKIQLALRDYLGKGNPLAYLIAIVTDSFKKGFPSSRIAPFVCDPKPDLNILFLMDELQALVSQYDKNNDMQSAIVKNYPDMADFFDKGAKKSSNLPIIREIADFLMLSLSINTSMLPNLSEKYSLPDIESRTKRYYGQASIDARKLDSNRGLVSALEKISDEFDMYLIVMKRFSLERLYQKINDEMIFNKAETYFKRRALERLQYHFTETQAAFEEMSQLPDVQADYLKTVQEDLTETRRRIQKLGLGSI